MKIIQSWWDIANQGKLSKSDLYTANLSHLTLQKNLGNITFYTNLKDVSNVTPKYVLPLPNVSKYNGILWCLGKLVAMSLQNEPFLHIDTDIFIFKKYSFNKFKFPFTVLHEENWVEQNINFYKSKVLPPPSLKGGYNIVSNNFGIVGGTNWKDLVETTQEILDHVLKHQDLLVDFAAKTAQGNIWVPVLIEQVWVSQIMLKRGYKPEPFLKANNFNDLNACASKKQIAHFWSSSKTYYEDEILNTYKMWKQYYEKNNKNIRAT